MIDLKKALNKKSNMPSHHIFNHKERQLVKSFIDNSFPNIDDREKDILLRIFSISIDNRHWNILTILTYDEEIKVNHKIKHGKNLIIPSVSTEEYIQPYNQKLYFSLLKLIHNGIIEEHSDNFVIMTKDTYEKYQNVTILLKL